MKIKKLSTLFAFAAGPIALLASPASDRKIEEAAKASYNYRTVLEDHVTVKAKDGAVTLTGTVQDKDEMALAEDTVENLPGVTRVNNELTIKSTYSEHSDAWIAFKIRSRLLVKAHVSAANTAVAVQAKQGADFPHAPDAVAFIAACVRNRMFAVVILRPGAAAIRVIVSAAHAVSAHHVRTLAPELARLEC